MSRLFHNVLSHGETSPASPASWLPPVPNEEDLALGWECACPVLQIERWLPDTGAADAADLN